MLASILAVIKSVRPSSYALVSSNDAALLTVCSFKVFTRAEHRRCVLGFSPLFF